MSNQIDFRRTIKELDYFLELMHELDIDQDYLDNF